MYSFKKLSTTLLLLKKTKVYELFSKNNINIYIINKKVSKRTIIHLEQSGDVIWEQLYPFGGMSSPSRVKQFLLKPTVTKGIKTILVLKGLPILPKGLDENIFVSSQERYKEGCVLVINIKQLPNILEDLK